MKKITPKQYAAAFVAAIEGKKVSHEHAAEHLVALIHRNGDWSRRKAILAACETLMRERERRELVVLESARPLTEEQRHAALAAFHGKKIDLEERVSPEAIAGVKIIVNGERQFDGTLKHKLDRILSA